MTTYRDICGYPSGIARLIGIIVCGKVNNGDRYADPRNDKLKHGKYLFVIFFLKPTTALSINLCISGFLS